MDPFCKYRPERKLEQSSVSVKPDRLEVDMEIGSTMDTKGKFGIGMFSLEAFVW